MHYSMSVPWLLHFKHRMKDFRSHSEALIFQAKSKPREGLMEGPLAGLAQETINFYRTGLIADAIKLEYFADIAGMPCKLEISIRVDFLRSAAIG